MGKPIRLRLITSCYGRGFRRGPLLLIFVMRCSGAAVHADCAAKSNSCKMAQVGPLGCR